MTNGDGQRKERNKSRNTACIHAAALSTWPALHQCCVGGARYAGDRSDIVVRGSTGNNCPSRIHHRVSQLPLHRTCPGSIWVNSGMLPAFVSWQQPPLSWVTHTAAAWRKGRRARLGWAGIIAYHSCRHPLVKTVYSSAHHHQAKHSFI